MLLAGNAFDTYVVERILELCHPSTPWWRRLWEPGTLLIVDELLEAGDPTLSVNEVAMDTLLRQFFDRVVSDPGCGPPALRNANLKMLPKKSSTIVRPGHDWSLLNSYADSLRASYLSNWSSQLRGTHTLSPELAARLLSAHLFDLGLSDTWLHRWITFRVKHEATATYTLADLVDLLAAKTGLPPDQIDVLVPLAVEVTPRPIPAGWLTPLQTAAWRAAHIPGSVPIRQHGGILLTVTARDVYAAGETVRERIVAIQNRFSMTKKKELVVGADMWLKGMDKSLPILGSPRRVEVLTLEQKNALWEHELSPSLESALELMAPLSRGSAPAAVTGAWAAIEGLLVGPGDDGKYLAIERLALITACAYVRSELTSLAWAHGRSSQDALAVAIKASSRHRERAVLVAAALRTGTRLSLPRSEDQHGCERIRALANDPHAFVGRVTDCFTRAFGGLYRQRNLLAHAGGTSGVAVRSTLHRTAPLVAAGIDRIADACLARGTTALELAALAQVRHESLRGRPAEDAVLLLN